MRHRLLTLGFLIACLTPLKGVQAKITKEINLQDFYHMEPYKGLKATMYINGDHTFLFMPALSNKKTLAHMCWGDWDFDSSKQTLTLSHGHHCSIINGTYQIEDLTDQIFLRNRSNKLIFKTLPGP